MKSETTARLVIALGELSRLHPEMRYGQMICNVATWARGPSTEATWDVEDEELLEAAEAHLRSKAVLVR